MKTERLYYADSHMTEFTAKVLECRAVEKGYAVELDRTAFFPEGGGQQPDTGYIGSAAVSDTQIYEDRIIHYVNQPLETGKEYMCTINREQRLRRMQNHSGEHIVSGIVHRLYSYNNVGFHMGENMMTIDFSGELDSGMLQKVETLANETVRNNVPVKTFFPEPDVLKDLDYRSKLELTEDVRIVEIEGIDRCACCAPHVSFTGEVGVIKILDSMRHRGGTRISLVCGMDALDDYRLKQDSNTAISASLSAKRNETAAAVERLKEEKAQLEEKSVRLNREIVRLVVESRDAGESPVCVFTMPMDEKALREIVNGLAEKRPVAAVFSPNENGGYNYIIGSRSVNLRAKTADINTALHGRGGGSPDMLRGRAAASKEEIEQYFNGELFN